MVIFYLSQNELEESTGRNNNQERPLIVQRDASPGRVWLRSKVIVNEHTEMLTARRVFVLAAFLATLSGCGGGGGSSGGPSPTYSITASVSGLSGAGLMVSVNGGPATSVTGNGMISVASGLGNGAAYSVAVAAEPIHPVQSCIVAAPSGTIVGSNATVQISCATSAATAQTSTMVSAGSDVPSAIQSSISQVATGWGTGTLGTWVPIQISDAAGDTILFALDSSGSIVLAAMTTSSQTTLSADSTALALERVLLANGSGAATIAQENTAIQGAAGYSALVALIDADLAANVRPLNDAQVDQALIALAASAHSALPAAGAARAQIKAALASPTMTDYGLFEVIPNDGTGNPAVPLVGILATKDGTNTLGVQNNMPMPWSAQTFTASASGASTPLGAAVVVPAETLLGGYGSCSPNCPPMNNSPFNFTLSQNQASLNAIALDFGKYIVSNVIKGVLGVSGTNCATTVIAAIGNIGGVTIADGGTFAATEKALVSSLSPSTVNSLFAQCSKPGLQVALIYTAIQQQYLSLLSTTLGNVSLATSSISLLRESYYANKYWDHPPYTVGVCAASDYSIHSCVASFSFSPTSLLMAPGASTLISLTGVDSNGMGTLLPGDVQITSQNPSIAGVAGNLSFTVTAAATGNTTVVVLDPATGATNVPPALNARPFPVNVTNPTLSPSATNFALTGTDQTLTVTLTGPRGEPVCGVVFLDNKCIVLPGGISWQATSTTTTINPVTVVGATGAWTIPANATPGTVQITAKDGNGNGYPAVTVTVTASQVMPTVTLTASPTSVTSGNSSTLTWSSTNATSCSATGGWTTSTATSGTASTGPLTATTSYTMVCVGSGGSATTSVTVTASANPWVGSWLGTITSTCGAYSGGFSTTLSDAGANSLNASDYFEPGHVLAGSFSLSVSGNTAVGNRLTLTLAGNSISLDYPPACQTAIVTKQ